MTDKELLGHPRQMIAAILQLEGDLLAGQLTLPEVKTENYLKASLDLLKESLMSIRHYAVSGEIYDLSVKKFSVILRNLCIMG